MNLSRRERLGYFIFGLVIGELFLRIFAPITSTIITFQVFGDHRAVHFFIGVSILVYYFLVMMFSDEKLLERPDFFFMAGNAISYIADEFIYAILQIKDLGVYESTQSLIWAFLFCMIFVAGAIYLSRKK